MIAHWAISFSKFWLEFSQCNKPRFVILILLDILLPPANEVWGKVICLQACVCPQWGGGLPGLGGSAPWGGACFQRGGVPGLGGCLLPGGLLLGGACSRGGGAAGGVWWRPPGRLLLRAVRILLECILVYLSEQNPIIYQVWNAPTIAILTVSPFPPCRCTDRLKVTWFHTCGRASWHRWQHVVGTDLQTARLVPDSTSARPGGNYKVMCSFDLSHKRTESSYKTTTPSGIEAAAQTHVGDGAIPYRSTAFILRRLLDSYPTEHNWYPAELTDCDTRSEMCSSTWFDQPSTATVSQSGPVSVRLSCTPLRSERNAGVHDTSSGTACWATNYWVRKHLQQRQVHQLNGVLTSTHLFYSSTQSGTQTKFHVRMLGSTPRTQMFIMKSTSSNIICKWKILLFMF